MDESQDRQTDRQTIKVMTDGPTETDRPTARQINRSNTCNLNISLSLHTPSKVSPLLIATLQLTIFHKTVPCQSSCLFMP